MQWKGEVSKGLLELAPEERLHAAEEMSDVLLYLVRAQGGVERCGRVWGSVG